MTTLTAPAPQASPLASAEEPIALFKLGALFVVRTKYWTCRVGNEPEDLNLTPTELGLRGIATLGTRDLIDPSKGRKVFQQIEKQARHALAKHSRVFPAAAAHFVPWDHAEDLIEQLTEIRGRFNNAVDQFLADYPQLRAEWQAEHPEIPNGCYPLPMLLRDKFRLAWHCFKVTGASAVSGIDDVEAELEQRRIRGEQLEQMQADLQQECQRFVEDYVVAFRSEVAGFCDQVVAAKGNVHGKTLNAIRDRIDRFFRMDIFNDADAADQLAQLKQQLAGVTGQDLEAHPAVAAKLKQACQFIRDAVLDPDNISQLTGRLKRRVVLD